MVSPVLAAADRLYWSRVIRRADIVDVEFVRLQLRRAVSARGAVRAYVRGGFRRGLSLNPLFLEQLVSAQLPDSDRVPALYAYLVGDPAKVSTTISWDAPAYAAAHPESLHGAGGPLGYAWRSLRQGGELPMGADSLHRMITHEDLMRTAATGLNPPPHLPPRDSIAAPRVLVWKVGAEDADGASLEVLASVASHCDDAAVILVLDPAAPDDLRAASAQISLWRDRTFIVNGFIEAEAEISLPPGTILLVRESGSEIAAEAVRAILSGAEARPVQALWLAPDGTIASAAAAAYDGQTVPLFAGHPIEDLQELGETIPAVALDAPVRAHRLGDLSRPNTLLDAHATRERRHAPALRTHTGNTDFDQLSPGRGLEFVTAAGLVPSLQKRHAERLVLADGDSVPRLRWAIKTAAPAGRRGESWGDTHFARGLAAALERLGQHVAIDAYPAARRATAGLDDVTVVLRGPERIDPPESETTIQWIISHPDEITSEEVGLFDIVFAASEGWSAGASTRLGRTILPLLQCSDAVRFSPRGLERSDDLVFVGTARGIVRPSVVEPLRAGAPLRVYGPDWRGYIPASAIAGTHVPNEELPLLYESAGAVMNDHWPAMQREGFVSNRLYDVVSAGGRAISDHVTGIPELFGGAVRTYRTTQELLELVASPLDSLFPAEDDLAEISSRVRRLHSFDARAKELLRAAVAHRI